MSFLGYNKGETLEFNYKKACGLWLSRGRIRDCTRDGCRWRTNPFNMQVFSIGYMVSFFLSI